MSFLAIPWNHDPRIDLEIKVRGGEVCYDDPRGYGIHPLQMPADDWIDQSSILMAGGEGIDQTDIFQARPGLFNQGSQAGHRRLGLGRWIALPDKSATVKFQACAPHDEDLITGNNRFTGVEIHAWRVIAGFRIARSNASMVHLESPDIACD